MRFYGVHLRILENDPNWHVTHGHHVHFQIKISIRPGQSSQALQDEPNSISWDSSSLEKNAPSEDEKRSFSLSKSQVFKKKWVPIIFFNPFFFADPVKQ